MGHRPTSASASIIGRLSSHEIIFRVGMLPIEYKEALQALKDQASSVTDAISAGTPDRPVGLADA